MESTEHLLPKGYQFSQGNYTIIKELGMGSFGITYLATDAFGEKVAIKELFISGHNLRKGTELILQRFSTEDFDKAKEEFFTEGKTIRQLRHDYIVRANNVFTENNTVYLVLDYVEGDNLKKWVQKNGTVPLDKLKLWLGQIGKALQYTHEKGIYHLDVKPSNIMISKNGKEAFLIDFGVSKQILQEELPRDTRLAYSQGYSAPEQQNRSVRPSATLDIHALGATAFFMLTGQHPTPPKVNEILEQLRIPLPIKNVIKKAMANKAKARPSNIDAFLTELQYDDLSDHTQKSAEEEVSSNKRILPFAMISVIGLVLIAFFFFNANSTTDDDTILGTTLPNPSSLQQSSESIDDASTSSSVQTDEIATLSDVKTNKETEKINASLPPSKKENSSNDITTTTPPNKEDNQPNISTPEPKKETRPPSVTTPVKTSNTKKWTGDIQPKYNPKNIRYNINLELEIQDQTITGKSIITDKDKPKKTTHFSITGTLDQTTNKATIKSTEVLNGKNSLDFCHFRGSFDLTSPSSTITISSLRAPSGGMGICKSGGMQMNLKKI